MVGKFVRYQGVTGGGTRFRSLSRVKREIVGSGIRKCRYHYIRWDVVGEPFWSAMGGQGRGMQGHGLQAVVSMMNWKLGGNEFGEIQRKVKEGQWHRLKVRSKTLNYQRVRG